MCVSFDTDCISFIFEDLLYMHSYFAPFSSSIKTRYLLTSIFAYICLHFCLHLFFRKSQDLIMVEPSQSVMENHTLPSGFPNDGPNHNADAEATSNSNKKTIMDQHKMAKTDGKCNKKKLVNTGPGHVERLEKKDKCVPKTPSLEVKMNFQGVENSNDTKNGKIKITESLENCNNAPSSMIKNPDQNHNSTEIRVEFQGVEGADERRKGQKRKQTNGTKAEETESIYSDDDDIPLSMVCKEKVRRIRNDSTPLKEKSFKKSKGDDGLQASASCSVEAAKVCQVPSIKVQEHNQSTTKPQDVSIAKSQDISNNNKLGLNFAIGDLVAIPKSANNYFVCKVSKVRSTGKRVQIKFMTTNRDNVIKSPKKGQAFESFSINACLYKFPSRNIQADQDIVIKERCQQFCNQSGN